MLKAKARRASFALAATVALAGFGLGHATADPGLWGDHARYEKVRGHNAPERLVLIAPAWVEDSVAKWRMVDYVPGERLVLRALPPR